jgi:excisionase family DNA binding protein
MTTDITIPARVTIPTHTPWLTRRQAMAYLQVSDSTISRAIESGRLRVFHINAGRQQRFNISDCDRYLTGGDVLAPSMITR